MYGGAMLQGLRCAPPLPVLLSPLRGSIAAGRKKPRRGDKNTGRKKPRRGDKNTGRRKPRRGDRAQAGESPGGAARAQAGVECEARNPCYTAKQIWNPGGVTQCRQKTLCHPSGVHVWGGCCRGYAALHPCLCSCHPSGVLPPCLCSFPSGALLPPGGRRQGAGAQGRRGRRFFWLMSEMMVTAGVVRSTLTAVALVPLWSSVQEKL